jgi:hypothetical protein
VRKYLVKFIRASGIGLATPLPRIGVLMFSVRFGGVWYTAPGGSVVKEKRKVLGPLSLEPKLNTVAQQVVRADAAASTSFPVVSVAARHNSTLAIQDK